MNRLLLGGVILLLACTPRIYLWPTGRTATEASPSAEPNNLAVSYCKDNAGRYLVQNSASGQQTGYCVFADRSACEVWSYYQGLCQPGDRPDFI